MVGRAQENVSRDTRGLRQRFETARVGMDIETPSNLEVYRPHFMSLCECIHRLPDS